MSVGFREQAKHKAAAEQEAKLLYVPEKMHPGRVGIYAALIKQGCSSCLGEWMDGEVYHMPGTWN